MKASEAPKHVIMLKKWPVWSSGFKIFKDEFTVLKRVMRKIENKNTCRNSGPNFLYVSKSPIVLAKSQTEVDAPNGNKMVNILIHEPRKKFLMEPEFLSSESIGGCFKSTVKKPLTSIILKGSNSWYILKASKRS